MQCRNWGEFMYLSRIELDMGRRETMKALVSLSKLHGAIEDCFSGGRARRLWRIDNLNGKKYILILSETVPELDRFAEQFGYIGSYETKDYSMLLDRVREEGKWRFRLTANPTISKSNGKIMAHITPEYQKKWLMDRAERCGFSVNVDEFQTVRSKWYSFRKREGDGSANIRLLSVTFEGLLTITDAGKFKATLCGGIGREKAYGQGLMTIIRA